MSRKFKKIKVNDIHKTNKTLAMDFLINHEDWFGGVDLRIERFEFKPSPTFQNHDDLIAIISIEGDGDFKDVTNSLHTMLENLSDVDTNTTIDIDQNFINIFGNDDSFL